MRKRLYRCLKLTVAASGAAFLLTGCALAPAIATKCATIGGCISKVPAISTIIRQNKAEGKGIDELIKELQAAYCGLDEMREVPREQIKAALVAGNISQKTADRVVKKLGEGICND